MPISGTRRMMAGGWATAGLDIKDPSLILYLPLWYPDSETTGSTIISKDINRRSCTVTGATWGSQGRTFDGINNRITIPHSAALNPSAISALTWVKLNETPSQYDEIIVKPTDTWELYFPTGASLFKPSFYVTATAGVIANSSVALVQGTFALVIGTYSSTDGARIYIDITQRGTAAANGILASENSTLSMSGSGARYLGMVLGEVLVYNRVLTVKEITNIYLATKWRYQ